MEHLKIFTQLIASELHLSEHAVENTLKLLDEGCTIPIYLPYKPKRRTRAQVARELGLEPLAHLLLLQREQDPKRAAQRFVTGDVSDVATALKGAQDIIAEQISEEERSRLPSRGVYRIESGEGQEGR